MLLILEKHIARSIRKNYMKPIKRVVSTSFWEDEKVVDMFSPEDKYFYIYLMTNPHTTQLGIYRLVPKTAAFELGYSKEAVKVLLDRFENKYQMIKYSDETNEVAIKNYLKHSILRGGKPVMDCLLKEEAMVEDISLLKYIYNHLLNTNKLNNTVKEYIYHLKEVINNDNDNERCVDVSLYESYTNRQSGQKSNKKFQPPTAEEILDYCSEKDLRYVNPNAFIDFYESKGWMVGKNKMSSWKGAVSGWNRRAMERGERPYVRPQIQKPIQQEQHTETEKEWDAFFGDE